MQRTVANDTSFECLIETTYLILNTSTSLFRPREQKLSQLILTGIRMSKCLVLYFRPYLCRTRNARLQTVTIPSIPQQRRKSSQPSKTSQSLYNADDVERRVSDLGGKDKIGDYFPRWQSSEDAPPMTAATFVREAGRKYGGKLQNGQTDAAEKFTVYGSALPGSV